MAKTSDLMGLGMSADLADLLGLNPVAVTCAGTTSGTATAITQDFNNLTAASNQTGAILPAVGASKARNSGALGGAIICANTSSTGAVIYPPSGATLNAASSHTIAQNGTAVYFYYSPTIIFAILSA